MAFLANENYFALDFDGVLANSLPIAIEEFRAIIALHFESIPAPQNQNDISHLFSGPLSTSLRRFGVSDEGSKKFFDLHSEAMMRRASEISLFPGAIDLLKNIPIEKYVIVTSAYSDAVRQILSNSECAEIASKCHVMGRELKMKKSSKLIEVSRKIGVDIANVIKIGDMVSDILYAKEAGAKSWAVGWGYHPIDYLAVFNPDRTFLSFDQLRDEMTKGILK